MNKKKVLYSILCALGGGIIGFFANSLTEWYGCLLFGRLAFPEKFLCWTQNYCIQQET